jgi:hypothetical protein
MSWRAICDGQTTAARNGRAPSRSNTTRPARWFGIRSTCRFGSVYELVTASLKAADTLASACPADTALSPVGRMETMRKRLAAVRVATAAIRPTLMRFFERSMRGKR